MRHLNITAKELCTMEEGQALVEYVLIISLIVLVVFISLKAVGLEIASMYFNKIWEIIKNALSTI